MEIPKDLNRIQRRIVTDDWKNNLVGYFVFNNTEHVYHFIKTTSDGSHLQEPEEEQLRKNPIYTGFIAYLISNLGKKATNEIYGTYINQVKQTYMDKLKYEPFFNSNTALNDFYDWYFLQEPISILNSSKIYSFIQKESVDLIQQYIKSYEDYINVEVKKVHPESLRSKFIGLKDLEKYRFHVGEDIDVMKRQYLDLLKEGFIACEENSFLFRMGYNVEDINLDKIKWIKENKKSNQPNKTSLLDYLTLIGIKESEMKNKINTIFEIPNGGKFKANNYSYVNGHLFTKSEYHDSLDKIESKSKER